MNLEGAREILVHHSKSKKNGAFAAEANLSAKMLNPICGDHVEIRARLENGVFTHLGFAAKACAICTASASLLAESANGWSRDQIEELKSTFEKAVTESEQNEWPLQLEPFRSFEHLRVNPRRRACAILPWLALAKLTAI